MASTEGERAQTKSIWLRETPTPRRPGYSRNEIARAAVALAAEGGFEAVSMRTLAKVLDTSTMSIYYYVRNKRELITLMVDEVIGETLIDEGDLPREWRAAITMTASKTRRAFGRHPWAIEHLDMAGAGPNGLRQMEQELNALAGTGLDQMDRVRLLRTINEYIFGSVIAERIDLRYVESGGWAETDPGSLEYIQVGLDTGQFPSFHEFANGDATTAMRRATAINLEDDAFGRGLNYLLDGIELSLAERRPEAD